MFGQQLTTTIKMQSIRNIIMYENKFMAPYFFFSSKSEICQKHDDIITQIMTGIILISLKIETMIAQLPVRYQCWDKYIGKILIFSSKDTLFLSLNSAFNPVFPSEKRELDKVNNCHFEGRDALEKSM